MGGDFAPEAAVKGAVMALGELGADCRIVLFGDRERILAVLAAEGCPAEKFDIVPTTEVIEMGDHPAKAFQTKTDSSITVGFGYLAKGAIQGFASAGSTGAMMVGSMYAVKPIEGVIRPTISSVVPTISGRPTKATHEQMKAEGEAGKFRFVGNIEASYIFTGKVADVIVCDGFVGNTVLKMAEGLYRINKALGVDNPFWNSMNYEMVGGTPVLGVNAPVIIGHGCSTPLAIKNMILSTVRCAEADLTGKLKSAFNN